MGPGDGELEHRSPLTYVSCDHLFRRVSSSALRIVTNIELPQAALAGGLGGTTGDMLMHSLDTVKTRQQGDPHMPPKYTSLGSSYYTIWRQEGVRRGLYGGWLPAMMGSFPGTVLFFGTYELSKRYMLDLGCQQHVAYLTAGKDFDYSAETGLQCSETDIGPRFHW
jgi:hypothetical protein